MTTREANDSRLATILRCFNETAFSGLEMYRILFQRITDTHYLEALGDWMPECRDMTKIEVIVNNAMCMYNKNHPRSAILRSV